MGHQDLINEIKQKASGKSALLIAGTTASGKSSIALELAKSLNGVIVNTDSMQVYADLRILSARPSLSEEAQAPHALYGHVDGAVNYNVALWLRDVENLLPTLQNNGQLPIFVGGTGLYFKALTQGLSPIPAITAEVRTSVRQMHEKQGVEAVFQELKKHDPLVAAKLKPTDYLRLCRALEVILQTGQSIHHWQSQPGVPLLAREDVALHVLDKPREAIYAAIDSRFDAMMELGALEEVLALKQRGLSTDLPIMRAHGVPWLIQALNGDISMNEAIEKSKADTRHYAKRQLTWWRQQKI